MRRGSARFAIGGALLGLTGALLAPGRTAGQVPESELGILRLASTPIGALPAIALPMPASRDDSYWGVRLQAAERRRGGRDLVALAGGIDFQWRGGSVFGITGGYQQRDCDVEGPGCGGHPLFGLRARFNFLTGGPTIGALLGDYSATSTLGAELGIGYAHDVLPGMDACSVDFGVPISLAMFQRVRVVSFITPAFALGDDCSVAGAGAPIRGNFLTGVGVGAQGLGPRGLDLYIGYQRIFRRHTGHQLGISATYVWVPSLAKPRRR